MIIQTILYPDFRFLLHLPLYSSRVSAGFPSPASDHEENRIDLNRHLVQHPNATFFVRAEGDSMIGAGIYDGDLLVVDRSVNAGEGSIIIAVVHGELTVKRLRKRGRNILLCAENPDYPDINVIDVDRFVIWGVVMHVIHSLT